MKTSPSPIVQIESVVENNLSPPSKIQTLLGCWEKRVSDAGGDVPDIARLAMSPRNGVRKSLTGERKSTKQTMQDLAVFASPREIQKKFVVSPKIMILPIPDITDPAAPPVSTPPTDSVRQSSQLPKTALETKHSICAMVEVPTIGSIRDRMKAFERRNDNLVNQAPWMPTQFRGRRGAVLDRFTPKHVAKENVLSKRRQEHKELPMVSLYQQTEETKDQQLFNISVRDLRDALEINSSVQEQESIKEPATDTTEIAQAIHKSESTPVSPINIKDVAKIDRDTLVLTEIRKMIKDTEDNEIEDEMDEDVKACLEKAALQSPAYTRRWYDALKDNWIHCPSLATIIMDFTLIEAAEVLYGDELPMLYTVSLRSVASEVMSGEEELPEYVYRLAS